MAMEYKVWVIEDTDGEYFTPDDIASSLLFLPVLREPRTVGCYTVINSRWEEYRGGWFRLPDHVKPKAAYEDVI